MLNALRPALDRVLLPIGRVLARTGATPNEITAVGTVGVSVGALGPLPDRAPFRRHDGVHGIRAD